MRVNTLIIIIIIIVKKKWSTIWAIHYKWLNECLVELDGSGLKYSFSYLLCKLPSVIYPSHL